MGALEWQVRHREGRRLCSGEIARDDLINSRADQLGDLSVKPRHDWPPCKPRTPLEPQDSSLLVQVRCWAGSPAPLLPGYKEAWKLGLQVTCGCVAAGESTPESSMGVPSLLLPSCLWEEACLFPISHSSAPLVGMVTTGLQISVGGAAATIPSRKIPGFSPAC